MNNTLALDREIVSSRTINEAIGVTFFILATIFGAYIRIPVPGTPVPITLQTFFVVMSGAVLGKKLGLFSQAGYIFLGALGLPVFQGYIFGMAHLLGPTGGYLIGFMVAAYLTGKILQSGNAGIFKMAASFAVANIALYTCGVLWLMLVYKIGIASAVRIGVLPFVAVESIKILAATFAYRLIADRSRTIFS